MRNLIFLCVLICFSNKNSFATMGADLPLLLQICSNTAAQLNELEILVHKTEVYTEKMRQYNELVIDHADRARRIANFAEEQIYIVSANPKDLGELNQLIKELRLSADNLEALSYEYKIDAVESKKGEEKAVDNEKKQVQRTRQLKQEALDSHSTVKGFQYQTKINTANVAVEASKTNENLLNLTKLNDKTNKMMAQENIRKIEEDKELRKYYRMDEKKKSYISKGLKGSTVSSGKG